MQNKRKNPRYMCEVPVEGKQGEAFEHSKAVDFSQGGIGLVSTHRLAVNKEIAIQLDLSEEGNSALVIGKVEWVVPIAQSNNYRIGLSFRDMMQNSRSYVKDYLREKQKS